MQTCQFEHETLIAYRLERDREHVDVDTYHAHGREGRLRCVMCESPVQLHAGTIKRWVFQHRAGFSDCAFEKDKDYKPESDTHIFIKEAIATWLATVEPEATVVVEAPLRTVGRIADVLIKRRNETDVAFEVQVSPLSGEHWRERAQAYASAEVQDVWLPLLGVHATRVLDRIKVKSLGATLLAARGYVYLVEIEASGEVALTLVDERSWQYVERTGEPPAIEEEALSAAQPHERRHARVFRFDSARSSTSILQAAAGKKGLLLFEGRYSWKAPLRDWKFSDDSSLPPLIPSAEAVETLRWARRWGAAEQAFRRVQKVWERADASRRAEQEKERTRQAKEAARIRRAHLGEQVMTLKDALHGAIRDAAKQSRREVLVAARTARHLPPALEKFHPGTWSPLADIPVALEWALGVPRQLWQMAVLLCTVSNSYRWKYQKERGKPRLTSTPSARGGLSALIYLKMAPFTPLDKFLARVAGGRERDSGGFWRKREHTYFGTPPPIGSHQETPFWLSGNHIRQLVIAAYLEELERLGVLTRLWLPEHGESAREALVSAEFQLKRLFGRHHDGVQSEVCSPHSIGEQWEQEAERMLEAAELHGETYFHVDAPDLRLISDRNTVKAIRDGMSKGVVRVDARGIWSGPDLLLSSFEPGQKDEELPS